MRVCRHWSLISSLSAPNVDRLPKPCRSAKLCCTDSPNCCQLWWNKYTGEGHSVGQQNVTNHFTQYEYLKLIRVFQIFFDLSGNETPILCESLRFECNVESFEMCLEQHNIEKNNKSRLWMLKKLLMLQKLQTQCIPAATYICNNIYI